MNIEIIVVVQIKNITQLPKDVRINYGVKRRNLLLISETVTVMEQCEQQGLTYNEHTDKCCKEGQIYKSGNKRCTNPPKKKKKSKTPPKKKKKSKTPPKRRQSTDEAGPSRTQREICKDKGLAYNEHTDKCCSNKNMGI